MSRSYRLGDLAERVGARVRGDAEREIRGIATLEDAGADELSFLTNSRYRAVAEASRAAAILVAPDRGPDGRNLLEADEPYVALAQLLELFHPLPAATGGISPDARVAEDARIGAGVEIGPFAVVGSRVELGDEVAVGAGCVVGDDCRLGARTRLLPRVVLYPETTLGSGCVVHAGVVLGADGFGFATSGGKHRKLRQVGRVVVEDDVEIGANSTVDRAMLGQTRIGRGTKIDDLVMLAHGVRVGEHSILVAQAGVAGSTRLGAGVTLAGQSGVAGHLRIGDGVTIAAKSAVFEDLEAGSFVSGIPAIDHRRWLRAQALFKKLPELNGRLRELESRLGELEQRLNGEE